MSHRYVQHSHEIETSTTGHRPVSGGREGAGGMRPGPERAAYVGAAGSATSVFLASVSGLRSPDTVLPPGHRQHPHHRAAH